MGVNHQVGSWWVLSKLFQISRLLSNSLDNLQFKSKKKRIGERNSNQRRKVEERRKKKKPNLGLHAQGGPTAIAKVEFQNLESPIQVKVEPKNGEEKGEK